MSQMINSMKSIVASLKKMMDDAKKKVEKKNLTAEKRLAYEAKLGECEDLFKEVEKKLATAKNDDELTD